MSRSHTKARVVAFVAGGPLALRALDSLHASHELVAVVRLAPIRGGVAAVRDLGRRIASGMGVLAPKDIDAWAGAAGVPVIRAVDGNDEGAARRVETLGPTIGCIATYPGRIGPRLLAACGQRCINLHTSLLPRHRGSDPLFWTYHAGDEEGGVSTHLATQDIDAGPVLAQTPCSIGRGEPVTDVHERYAELGATLVTQTISDLAGGHTAALDQDESLATRAPRVRAGNVYSDLGAWKAAHAWHFLSGLAARYQDPFEDENGRAVPYRRVEGYEVRPPQAAPGAVVRDGRGWIAWATDGAIHLAP